MSRVGRVFAEMRRRRVFRTGGLFLIGAWVAIQVASEVVEPLGLPVWTTTFLVWAAVIGFPVALLLGWRYELGPRGITRTTPAVGEQADLTLKPSDYLILTLVVFVTVIVTYGVVLSSLEERDTIAETGRLGDGPQTLAVLPFGTDAADASISQDIVDGFVDQLREQLSQISGLRAQARASSNAFRDVPREYQSIADRLRVQLLIEGSFYRDVTGSEALLCARIELIARSGFLLPGGSRDVCDEDIVPLQQAVTTWIAQFLLPDVESVASNVVQGSQINSAQENMLLGDSLYNKVRDADFVDPESLDRAIDYYRLTVRQDPGSALAHQRLASALLWRGDIDEAYEHIANANRIDSDLSAVQMTFGDYYFAVGSGNAGTAWRRAVELNPNDADAQMAYALWLWLKNDYSQPAQHYRRAISLDPLSLYRYADFGEFLGMSGQVEETLALADEILEWFAADARSYRTVARLHELVGRNDEAIAWALRALAFEPENDDLKGQIAEHYYRIGDFDTGELYDSGRVVGLLFHKRDYEHLIEVADELLFEGDAAYDLNVIYLQAFAYGALDPPNPDFMVRLLSAAHLPEEARREAFTTTSVQASVYMIRALFETDRVAEAVRHAQWFIQFSQTGVDNGGDQAWWFDAFQACALAGIGRAEEAFEHLERLPFMPGLVWYPLLRDALCFKHMSGHPRYEAVVQQIEERMAGYRARLPETLRAHGLTP